MSSATKSPAVNSNGAVDNYGIRNVTNQGVAADTENNSNLSNTTLEYKLKQLRDESMKHGQTLTQKLATSQSGQNLLHIGTSLSSLPPDLHQLVTQLHPLISSCEAVEKKQVQRLDYFVSKLNDIKATNQRVIYAMQLEEMFNDLKAAEQIIGQQQPKRTGSSGTVSGFGKKQSVQQTQNRPEERDRDNDNVVSGGGTEDLTDARQRENDELDNAMNLERSAHITLSLIKELQSANEYFTKALSSAKTGSGDPKSPQISEDTEHAQFIVKLAPRIRRLESDTVTCLTRTYETMLRRLQNLGASLAGTVDNDAMKDTTIMDENGNDSKQGEQNGDSSGQDDVAREYEVVMLILGHCMRGLALLGRASDVESIFARTAILPLIRSKISMGLLDEGGARGECKGLPNLLKDFCTTIAATYRPLLVLAESMFVVITETKTSSGTTTTTTTMVVDLLTGGIWAPFATALMADSAIKMTIFSPGIASILQANYVALDSFLSQLASTLLAIGELNTSTHSQMESSRHYYYQPTLSPETVRQAQNRIYSHPKTTEFSKKWNLPIYYQLRFGEFCSRLNKAIDKTQREGWTASEVFTGPIEKAENLKKTVGFELGLFLELYDILTRLWRPDVILSPLTNRFLRGAIQIIGRLTTFISEGMAGDILFGVESAPKKVPEHNDTTENGAPDRNTDEEPYEGSSAIAPFQSRKPYCWGESEEDVAAVAWELSILDSMIRNDYITIVCESISNAKTSIPQNEESSELTTLVGEVLEEASAQMQPIIDKAWNDQIVKLLIAKCSGPLAAVKGVAATYRMTNRPPPTQASPFVGTILRPVKEFDTEFVNRTPERIGSKWKQHIVATVAERYATAVEELIVTVQRTEEALKNRKARRVAAGGTTMMSDGEKVKLQLYLDYEMFTSHVRELGIEPTTVIGLSKLQELTAEGERLLEQLQPKTARTT